MSELREILWKRAYPQQLDTVPCKGRRNGELGKWYNKKEFKAGEDMYISDVRIENYRTFQDVTFHFDSRANYIVGDNNIGKSNFLSFLKTVTHGYGFREADFLDENNPIRVFFTLSSADMGTGEFAHIELRQLVSEVVPTLINSDTGERLPLEYMRCLFYIDYALDDVPRNMVTDEELLQISSLYKDYLSAGEETIREAEELLAKKGFRSAYRPILTWQWLKY